MANAFISRLALIAVPLLLSACAGSGSTSKQPAPAGNEIVIGVAGPMTGDLAAFGEQLRRGAEQAVADLNAEGGVLGKKLRLVIGDDQCDPKRAVQVAQQLIADGAVFVDGHFCSGSSIPASDSLWRSKGSADHAGLDQFEIDGFPSGPGVQDAVSDLRSR